MLSIHTSHSNTYSNVLNAESQVDLKSIPQIDVIHLFTNQR